MQKILIVRFSSIGDIVLTTPVIRCVKKQLGDEVHFVTKESFKSILAANPYVDRLHVFKNDIEEILPQLRAENFDIVIDLHKNLRSYRLKRKLRKASYTFDKLNLRKFLAVRFKMTSLLPAKHIVDRYFDGLLSLGIKNDGEGLDHFIKPEEEILTSALFFEGKITSFMALVVGGSYYTKKIPIEKLAEICSSSKLPVVLLGGKDDREIADRLVKDFPSVINTCGNLSVNQSASVLRQAEWVVTSDTGMMHFAAAFRKKIISVWGNTIPEFGMSPYMAHSENRILEVNYLDCRPCSKLGYKKCPRGHFKCMLEIDYSFIKDLK